MLKNINYSQMRFIIFSEPDDSGPLRAELLRTEIELSQKTEQCLMADRQIQQFELTLSQLTAQYKAVILIIIMYGDDSGDY